MIVLFPTYARRLADTGWRATVAGMVTRPLPARSHRRSLAVAVLKRLLELDDADLDTVRALIHEAIDNYLDNHSPTQGE